MMHLPASRPDEPNSGAATSRWPLTIYRALLLAYPAKFRASWHVDLEESFLDMYNETRDDSGAVGALRFLLRAAVDAIWRGLRTRSSAWHGARVPGPLRPNRSESGRLAWLVDVLLQDLRQAMRTCRAAPAVSALAVLVFALGIGANTIVYSIVEAALVRSLPYAAAVQLVDVNMVPDRVTRSFAGGGTVSLEAARAWREHVSGFEEAAIYTSDFPALSGRGDAVRVHNTSVTHNLFELLGARPLLGRTFHADGDTSAAPREVVIGHAFWTQRFGADPAALGQTLILDAQPFEIIGVMPPAFRFPVYPPGPGDRQDASLWTPFGLAIETLETTRRLQGGCWIVARVRKEVSTTELLAQLDHVVSELGDDDGPAWVMQANVTPLHAYVVGDTRRPLLMLQGAVGFVLLIACANVANLLLARSVVRERELTVRWALGASRVRLVFQALVESSFLAVLGGTLGVVVAYFSLPPVLSLSQNLLPRVGQVQINSGALALIVIATLLIGLLAGTAPALRTASSTTPTELRSANISRRSIRATGRLTRILLAGQITLALVLVTGAGLLLQSFLSLAHVDLGFDADQVVVADLNLPKWAFPDGAAQRGFAEQLAARMRQIPGTAAAAVSTGIPLAGGMFSGVRLPDRPDLDQLPWAAVAAVTASYFDVFGVELIRGRGFDDAQPGNKSAILDLAAAKAYFADDDPLGKQLTFGGRGDSFTVVGVVGDVRQESLRDATMPHVYVALDSMPMEFQKASVRVRGNHAAVAAALRAAVQATSPDVPIERIATMRVLVSESLQRERFYSTLVVSFALVALAMMCSGIYGVTSHFVSRSQHELGVRIALGASPRSIHSLVLGRGMRVVLCGVLLGIGGAAVTTRLLQSLLFDLTPLDPATFAAAAVLASAVGLLATYVPAQRAARVDPLESIRAE